MLKIAKIPSEQLKHTQMKTTLTILFSALALMFASSMKAQYDTESFEDDFENIGWSTSTDIGEAWDRTTSRNRTGSYSARVQLHNSEVSEDILMSPYFQPTSTYRYVYYYDRRSNCGGCDDAQVNLEVESLDNPGVWNSVDGYNVGSVSRNSWSFKYYSLNAYSGETVRVRFRVTKSTNSPHYYVDDISLPNVLVTEDDISLNTPLISSGVCEGFESRLEFEILNESAVDQVLTWEYKVDDGIWQDGEVDLAVNAFQSYNASYLMNVAEFQGEHDILIRLKNHSDDDPSNDEIVFNVDTRDRIDQDFEEATNWVTANNNSDAKEWVRSTDESCTGSYSMVFQGGTFAADDYLLSPCVKLENIVPYIFTFSYKNVPGFAGNHNIYFVVTDPDDYTDELLRIDLGSPTNTVCGTANINLFSCIDEFVRIGFYIEGFGTNDFVIDNAILRRDQQVYYGNSSGDLSASIWKTKYDAGNQTINSFSGKELLIIDGNSNISLDSDALELGSVVVKDGSSFNSGNNNFDLKGDLTVEGSADLGTSTVTFSSQCGVQDIDGDILIEDINVNNGSVVTMNSGTVSLHGSLEITDGGFITNDSLTLVSDENGTGRIGEIGVDASFTGEVTLQRLIPSGKTNWRFLTNIMKGATLADWNDDFITSGFPGSDAPWFSFTSIYSYEEDYVQGGYRYGYRAAQNVTDAVNAGEGYWVWCGDTITSTNAFMVDATGEFFQGDTTINITHTITGAGDDGYNLVANPYPSQIDFDALQLTNAEEQYYIFDPQTGNSSSWNRLTRVGTGGANGIIASSQGFWLIANEGGGSVTFNESAKVDATDSPLFLDFSERPLLGLVLSSTYNEFSDEVKMILTEEATTELDPFDSEKLFFSDDNAPTMYWFTENVKPLSVSALPINEMQLTGRLVVDVPKNGDYTMTASEMLNLDKVACVSLKDLQTGLVYDLRENDSFTFIQTANNTTPRFELTMTLPVEVEVSDLTCFGDDNGRASFSLGNADNATGKLFRNGQFVKDVDLTSEELTGLTAGEYVVELDNAVASCSNAGIGFTVSQPELVSASVQTVSASCDVEEDGQIILAANGGNGFYNYFINGEEAQPGVNNYFAPGKYIVTLEDGNACQSEAVEVTVTSQGRFVDNFFPEEFAPEVGEVLDFEPEFVFQGNTYTWNFPDGSVAAGSKVKFAFKKPGYQFVQMTENASANCANTVEKAYFVSTATGIDENELLSNVEIIKNNGKLQFQVSEYVTSLSLYTVNGQLITAIDANGSNNLEMNVESLTTGVYLLQANIDGNSYSVKINL